MLIHFMIECTFIERKKKALDFIQYILNNLEKHQRMSVLTTEKYLHPKAKSESFLKEVETGFVEFLIDIQQSRSPFA